MELKKLSVKNIRIAKRTLYAGIGFIGILLAIGILFTLLPLNSNVASASSSGDDSASSSSAVTTSDSQVLNASSPDATPTMSKMRSTTDAQRRAAAALIAAARQAGGAARPPVPLALTPGGTPDYFGTIPNYANSPLPIVNPTNGTVTGGIRKFVDSLPGLGPTAANNLGQYIPLAVADNTTYNGSDYYEIGLVEYTEKMHSDLNPTTLRGYVQLSTAKVPGAHIPLKWPNGTNIRNATGVQVFAVDNPHYLGPMIISQMNRPVRVKFTNLLPTTSTGGNLFLPVDTTVMGAGPYTINATNFSDPNLISGNFSQNRATLHLHGGVTPWISDGTPHQWTTPAGENTSYPRGVSVRYVPDMDGGVEPNGTLTFYYTNQQSARLMFYHDHAFGITRLNVYAGEAAPYLETDPVEQLLINQTILPDVGIPLVIQDKAFLPDNVTLAAQDPTWPFTVNASRSDLWFPHVYMPNQDPALGATLGANAMGRWAYGPWFFPPWVPLVHGPVANPLYNPTTAPWENSVNPGTPNPSDVPEAFVDTPVVNGNAYPYVPLGQKAYRFRILGIGNDRMWNLQLYYAWTAGPYVIFTGGGGSGAQATATVAPNGSITGITVVGNGVGYTTAPTVSIFDAPRHTPAGSGATATATISGNIVSIAVTNGGSGYTSAPAVGIAGGGGSGAFAVASVDLALGSPTYGKVTSVTVTNGGTGFTTAPNISFIGGGGLGASAVATISTVVTGVTITNGGSGYAVPTECRGTAVTNRSLCTEVSMVPAAVGAANFPASWTGAFGGVYDILDGRAGGIPNPASIGPNMWQVGTEGGFLPNAVLINNRPVGWDHNTRSITIGNVLEKALWIGPAERTDIVVDFSGVPDGSTLILYNDAPAPVPGFDLRNDYYTNDPDNSPTGGAPSTIPGYGPNTRTVMQIQVNSSLGVAGTYNVAALQSALPTAYGMSQPQPIVPEYRYNTAFGASYPLDPYVRIQDTSINFTPAGSATNITMQLQSKAIQELFTFDYGRMNALLGLEVPLTNGVTQTTIPYGYIDVPTEIILNSNASSLIGTLGDGTQIWKVTHNGVDTHAIHVHLFNAQLLNRVGWDGSIRPPNDNEIGWKDTIIMNPLEDAIIALRPIKPNLPWDVPNSIRPLDVTAPLGSTGQFGATTNFSPIDPQNNPVTVTNHLVNFGWEYVWHCHLLGHEENDMMRPILFTVAPNAPINLVATAQLSSAILTWTDNSSSEVNWTIQRAPAAIGPWTTIASVASTTGPGVGATVTYTDPTAGSTTQYYRVNATNIVGDTTVYAAPAVGFPNMTADSAPSNTAFTTASAVNLTVFAHNATNTVLYNKLKGSGWQSLGCCFVSNITAISSGSNITIFARSGSNSIYARTWNGSAWSNSSSNIWQNLGCCFVSDIGATSSGSNISIFARSGSNSIYTRSWNGSAWGSWQNLGCCFVSNIGATSSGSNISIFARSGANFIYTRSWNGSAWSNSSSNIWQNLGGIVASNIAASSDAGNITIFGSGTDNVVRTQNWNGTWSGWQSLPGINATSDTASISLLGQRYVFVSSTDTAVWVQIWNGSAWGGWTSIGGSIIGKPAVTTG